MSQHSEIESLQAKINYATRKSIDRQQKRFQSTKNTRMFVTKREFSRKNALKNATSLIVAQNYRNMLRSCLNVRLLRKRDFISRTCKN